MQHYGTAVSQTDEALTNNDTTRGMLEGDQTLKGNHDKRRFTAVDVDLSKPVIVKGSPIINKHAGKSKIQTNRRPNDIFVLN